MENGIQCSDVSWRTAVLPIRDRGIGTFIYRNSQSLQSSNIHKLIAKWLDSPALHIEHVRNTHSGFTCAEPYSRVSGRGTVEFKLGVRLTCAWRRQIDKALSTNSGVATGAGLYQTQFCFCVVWGDYSIR